MSFNLDDYEPVASRVQRFYEAYPAGAIHCDIVFDDGKRVLVKATIYRNVTDPIPAAVDYAEEHLTDRGVNATSRVENACTSAIGRAVSVAAAGLAPTDFTKKPTREEMSKVQRMGGGADRPAPQPGRTITNKYANPCHKCGARVEVGAGIALQNAQGKWETFHNEGQCDTGEEPF